MTNLEFILMLNILPAALLMAGPNQPWSNTGRWEKARFIAMALCVTLSIASELVKLV